MLDPDLDDPVLLLPAHRLDERGFPPASPELSRLMDERGAGLRLDLASWRRERASLPSPERTWLRLLLGEGAARADDESRWLHYWMSEVSRAALPLMIAGALGEEQRELGRLARLIQDMVTLGINLRGRRPEVFRAAHEAGLALQIAQDAANEDREGLRLLGALAAAATYAAADFELAFDVLERGPWNQADPARLLARLAGLFHRQAFGRAQGRDAAEAEESE